MTQTPHVTMSSELQLRCSEIWGGIGDIDTDIESGPVTVSVFSRASDGHRGGDIYYFTVCESGAIVRLAVADVVGHGVAASRVSSWIYRALTDHVNTVGSTNVLLELNRAVNRIGLRAMTTATVLSFHVDESRLSIASAGHPPVWLRRSNEAAWRRHPLLRGTPLANVPLGVFAESVYEQEDVQLRSGDRLLVHTDGLTEAMSPSGRQLGDDGLGSVLARNRDASVGELKRHVLDAVRTHTGGGLGHDDLTFMILEVH